MDLLKSYGESGDESSSDSMDESLAKSVVPGECKSLSLGKSFLDVAPCVATKHDVGGVSCVVPVDNQLMYNPKFEDLFQPEVKCAVLSNFFG